MGLRKKYWSLNFVFRLARCFGGDNCSVKNVRSDERKREGEGKNG